MRWRAGNQWVGSKLRANDGSLHRITGRAIEGEVVDHRADDHASPHELADGVTHILVISAKAINPTDHKHIARPQLVEEPATLGTLDKATCGGLAATRAVVPSRS
jgi:hypothetical protein